jgi:small subunit ribosomal protein S5
MSFGVKVVFIKRSARATSGGQRFTFSAMVAFGDKSGRIGLALGKAKEVAAAILKAEESAAAQMVHVSLKAGTIPHEVWGTYCGARVLLRPASPGTGIIANRTVRALLECAGVKNAIGKSLGAHNEANVAKATLQALRALRLPDEVHQRRGLKIKKTKTPVLLKFSDLLAGKNPLDLN